MKKTGWIYVTNWNADKNGRGGLQHYHDRAPSWIKLHLKLLGNDAWLELSAEDRVLLITIWMLTGRYGNGRVKADQRWLMEQAKLSYGPRSRNLERLNHAGFITIKSRRGLEPVYPLRTTEKEGSKEPKKRESARDALAQPVAAHARAPEQEPEPNGWEHAAEARERLLALVRETKP